MKPEYSVSQAYLAASRRRLGDSVTKIKHCLGQLNDEQVWWRPHEAQNSIANLILHLCGNVRQWIISGVGGAPDVRNRPSEFAERSPIPRPELIRLLEEMAREADSVLARVSDKQLLEPRRIQGFDETALSAIFDSLTHFQGHTQEIICLTRMQLKEAYQFAWMPASKEQGALEQAP
jgi:hypothetical protein